MYAGGLAASPTLRNPDGPITIEHLLTHTTGLTYGYFGDTPVDSLYRRPDLIDPASTVAQFADRMAAIPLLFSPGKAWNYSMSIDVLGRVVEVASGRPTARSIGWPGPWRTRPFISCMPGRRKPKPWRSARRVPGRCCVRCPVETEV